MNQNPPDTTTTPRSVDQQQACSVRTCATCKYKETAGMMVDPCFPCLQETSIWSGEPKPMYDAWVDENTSWEEIEAMHKETEALFEKIFNESPELQSMKREIDSQNTELTDAHKNAP